MPRSILFFALILMDLDECSSKLPICLSPISCPPSPIVACATYPFLNIIPIPIHSCLQDFDAQQLRTKYKHLKGGGFLVSKFGGVFTVDFRAPSPPLVSGERILQGPMRADLGQIKLENSRGSKDEEAADLSSYPRHEAEGRGEGHERGRGKHSLFWYREGRKPSDVTPAKPLRVRGGG